MHTTHNFKIIKIPKSRNTYRTIYIPNIELTNELRKLEPILKKILYTNIGHCKDHAFILNRNCATNAATHIGKTYILSLDIESFFDSITPALVKKYINKDIINVTFINNAPRQGLLTSPIISNIAMIDIDILIIKSLAVLGDISYSRYADDLTFGFNDVCMHKPIKIKIIDILRSHGFSIKKKKTKFYNTKHDRAIITGIAIDQYFLYPSRKTIKKIRAAKHQKNINSHNGLIEWSKCKSPNPNRAPYKMNFILDNTSTLMK